MSDDNLKLFSCFLLRTLVLLDLSSELILWLLLLYILLVFFPLFLFECTIFFGRVGIICRNCHIVFLNYTWRSFCFCHIFLFLIFVVVVLFLWLCEYPRGYLYFRYCYLNTCRCAVWYDFFVRYYYFGIYCFPIVSVLSFFVFVSTEFLSILLFISPSLLLFLSLQKNQLLFL